MPPEARGQLASDLNLALYAALLVAAGQLGRALWDYAVLGLIVTVAGGKFTGAAGQAHPVIGTGRFSNGAPLHTAALVLLQQAPREYF